MTIDFNTMRVNCIQIHQETFELLQAARQIGLDLGLIVNDADQLANHEQTKSWDGMGRFAKQLLDNSEMWDKLPSRLWIFIEKKDNGPKKEWIKDKAKSELLDCFYQLGGYNLLNLQTQNN